MTFDFAEKSHQHAAAIEMYRFSIADPTAPGGADVDGYTNAENLVSYNGQVYKPIPIKRDAIKVTGALDKAQISVTMSAVTPIAALLQGSAPSGIVSLTIYRAHTTDKRNEVRLWWTGRVTNYSRKQNEVTLLCESNVTSLARPGLRRNYQYQCPLQLYGPDCRANKQNFNYSATAPSAGNIVLARGFEILADLDTFRNGTLNWVDPQGKTQKRWITAVSVQLGANTATTIYTFTVSGVATGIGLATPLIVNPGCSKTRNICRDRFNNIENFGGQPFIPTNNPNGNTSPFL